MNEIDSLKSWVLLLAIPLFVVVFAITAYTSRIAMLHMLTYDEATEAKLKIINQKTAEIETRIKLTEAQTALIDQQIKQSKEEK